jgi:hypothetical protein
MSGPQIPKDFRTVIVAASVGNVIEWYDFYIFGSLAAVGRDTWRDALLL